MSDTQSSPFRPGQRVHYRSEEQLANDPKFRALLEREFPEGAAENPGFFDAATRRAFLATVGASAGALTLASCRKPYHQILPYNRRPEGLMPGLPQDYATTHDANGYGVGIVVRSNTGRPTKVEGNPEHADSVGATDAFAQAELLNLYDPKRSKSLLHLGRPAAAAATSAGHDHDHHDGHDHDHKAEGDHDHPHAAQAFSTAFGGLVDAHSKKRGDGLHILIAPTTSPTVEAMLDKVAQAHPKAVVHTWSPVNRDAELAASRIAFGDAFDQRLSLDKAQRVVSFDHDFLGLDGGVRDARDWAKTRKARKTDEYKRDGKFLADGGLGRLYVCEAAHSTTGSNADHRFRVPQSKIPAALAALAAELGMPETSLGRESFESHGKNWVAEVAKDLLTHKGRSAVLVGPRLPAAVQALGHAINAHLGNIGSGKPIQFAKTPKLVAQAAGLDKLTKALDSGSVETLLVLGLNPVYSAPADLGFAAKLKKAKTSVHLGLHADETAKACTWHVPMAHPLESWGDLIGRSGDASIVQPLIAPLFGGLTTVDVLGRMIDDDRDSYEVVKATWEARYHGGDGFTQWFETSIHDGVLRGQSVPAASPSVDAAKVASALSAIKPGSTPTKSAFDVILRPCPKVYDGRYSNNAWMQELPDSLTKLVWDNAALMARHTAEDLDVSNGDVVKLTVGGASIEAPVWILPGTAANTIILNFGYGRELEEGAIANLAGPDVNAYRLSTTAEPSLRTGVQVTKTGRTYPLVSSQDHGSMEERPLARDADFVAYQGHHMDQGSGGDHGHGHDHGDEDHGGHGHGHHEAPFGEKDTPYHHAASLHYTAEDKKHVSLFPEQLFPKKDKAGNHQHQWGMSIDLNSCTGCGACVVACVAENNIPMVGKRQVSMGREMHWLRMDRYFSGKADSVGRYGGVSVDDDVQVHHQMVPCMQCENAPCESVCPVNATVHNDQGLNDMVYNRCIGTRYCSNNCPYKVRRFNWLNFHANLAPETQLAFNPDVTVRVRGVMEKCTYCVQRINNAKIGAKLAKSELKDGDVVTACAQACPADAIAFGDLNDHDSEVYKRKRLDLNYAMLGELNVRPRTTYLLKLRNPNPKLVATQSTSGAAENGHSKKHG